MLHFYHTQYTTYCGSDKLYTSRRCLTCAETPPKEESVLLTWDNIEEQYKKLGLVVPFTLLKTKRGKKLVFFHGEHRTIKEWKTMEPCIYIAVETKEVNLPIEEVLEYHDGQKAIQYLVERGLSIIGRG